jgi:hypothetical protein
MESNLGLMDNLGLMESNLGSMESNLGSMESNLGPMEGLMATSPPTKESGLSTTSSANKARLLTASLV